MDGKACGMHAGEYELRSLKVLKKSGYFSHVINGGWLWSRRVSRHPFRAFVRIERVSCLFVPLLPLRPP